MSEALILIDGRWCQHCGGLAAYKQRLVGRAIQTCLWCWSCGRRCVVHVEPPFLGEVEGDYALTPAQSSGKAAETPG